jgi:rhodanese-related sulfurtransferase
MITRERFSVLLLVMGLIMVFLPFPGRETFTVKPVFLLRESQKKETFFSVDEVAGFVMREDSTVQLIDVRSPREFKNFNIPGSVNIPLSQIVDKEWEGYLGRENIRNIFYSNGDTQSNYAWIIAAGLRYKNTSVMRGGLNDWFRIVMNSKFSGETISPRENWLFETRTRAKNLFISINSLPDSLKTKFMETKKIATKKLDGGCE